MTGSERRDKVEHSFFTRIKAEDFPKTTAQQKKFSTRTKTFYETPKTKLAKGQLARALSGHQPKEPFNMPIELTVIWVFPKTKQAKNGQRKDTRPDLDNLQKSLQDMLAKLNYYKDDSLITDLVVKKRWHESSGLYIKIREVEKIDDEFLEFMKEV